AVERKVFHGGLRAPSVAGALGSHEDRLRMSVMNVRARAGAGHREGCWLTPGTEDLTRLTLDLLLLAGDVGDDIVDHVEGEHTAAPAPSRDGLHRGHHHGPHPEGILKWLERDHQPGGGAVWDWCDEASPATPA